MTGSKLQYDPYLLRRVCVDRVIPLWENLRDLVKGSVKVKLNEIGGVRNEVRMKWEIQGFNMNNKKVY